MFNSTKTPEFDSPYFTWTKDLSIGNALIDADHQRIFDTANRLQAEMTGEPEHSILGEVLVELIEHTGGHFVREEALMQAIQFPRYEEHKLEHSALMLKVNDLHRRFMDGRSNLSIEVAEFLHDWLIPHLMNSDMELARSMRAVK